MRLRAEEVRPRFLRNHLAGRAEADTLGANVHIEGGGSQGVLGIQTWGGGVQFALVREFGVGGWGVGGGRKGDEKRVQRLDEAGGGGGGKKGYQKRRRRPLSLDERHDFPYVCVGGGGVTENGGDA
uniref:Uncharacterized protein n=1 Tax=Knipowitschia caucasica TaxID=637954 RepID=A0AAV2L9Q2_KNICA